MKLRKSKIVEWTIILIILFLTISIYKKNNFNEYIRSEANLYTSKFERDNKEKYSKNDSYKIITNNTKNDASFYKEIKVRKNTPYRVTCMVKTENVIPENDISGIGAQISIMGTTEKSTAITGTNDWKKLELIFNSKDREVINIGFRLGGYLGECTGTAWFSDFTLEQGVEDYNNEWKFACFIFEETDVTIDGKEVKIKMEDSEISDIKNTIKRFENTCKNMSNEKMKAKCSIYKANEPIKKLTYDEEFGYYVAPEDVENTIKDTIKENNYDHIFIIIKLRK